MSINCITLTGRLCKDPELKTTQTDKSVCSFNVAVDDGWGDNKKTLFMTIVSWNSQAEYISKYGHKGDMIALSGRLTSRDYKNKEGIDVKVYEIVASTLQIMSSKSNNDNSNNSEPAKATNQNNFIEVDYSDDLPF